MANSIHTHRVLFALMYANRLALIQYAPLKLYPRNQHLLLPVYHHSRNSFYPIFDLFPLFLLLRLNDLWRLLYSYKAKLIVHYSYITLYGSNNIKNYITYTIQALRSK